MTLLDNIKYIDYNYVKGYYYEEYVLSILHQFYNVREAYLWKNVPYRLFLEASIIIDDDKMNIKKRYQTYQSNIRFKVLLDTGIDIVAKLKNNDILLIQCKCYSHRCISQKNLGGFYRTILDTIVYNKTNKKRTNIYGVIAHSNYLSDIITSSYSYKTGVVQDIFIPYENISNDTAFVQNKLKRYKDIVFIINSIMILINISCLFYIMKFQNINV
jgi:hypothetical protein